MKNPIPQPLNEAIKSLNDTTIKWEKLAAELAIKTKPK